MASSVAKHTPIYNLTVSYTNSKGAEKKLELSSPFTRWFDVDGFFIAKPFQQWLASEVPLIGQIDTKNRPGNGSGSRKTNGTSEAMAVVVEQKVDVQTPRKATGSEAAPPSTRSRKGKKAAER